MHPIEQRADLQPAPLEVSLTVFLEAFGIGDRPGVAAADAQMLDREPAREAHHLFFALGVHPVAQLLSQMAEAAWYPISPLASASATCGNDSSCRPTQRRSPAVFRERPQVRATQPAGVSLESW